MSIWGSCGRKSEWFLSCYTEFSPPRHFRWLIDKPMQTVSSGLVARVSQPVVSKAEKRLLQSTSPAMEQVLRAMENLALTDVPVLVVGEPGTGKQALAEQIPALAEALRRVHGC